TGASMVENVNVIGRGRVGSALAARLEERGIPLVERDGELTLLCVPDTAIREVARGLTSDWIAHVSGATPLSALDPHERRFSLHRGASGRLAAAGAPPEALGPLMRRTIENGFELTGPIERGDWATVEAHRAAIRSVRPDLEPLYDVLAEATVRDPAPGAGKAGASALRRAPSSLRS